MGMFHGKHPADDGLTVARRAALWAGTPLTSEQEGQLAAYAAWLTSEAIESGGLGRGEATRLWPRHIADSLVFAVGWRQAPPPATLLDVGSGVGLPGIPLAIGHPQTQVTLLDRSGRRVGLARRAIRVLGLDNVAVLQEDASRHRGTYSAVTMRAALGLPDALRVVDALLSPGGVGVIAASRRQAPRLETPTVTVIEVPGGVLDSPAWLLRMTASNDDGVHG